MIENLNNLVREEAADTIIQNPAIPNEKNEDAIQAATGSIEEVLHEKTASGNFAEVSGLFGGGDILNNPIVQKIKEVFAGKLGNLGVDQSSALGAAGGIIPALIEKFVRRTNDPNDSSFNLQDLLKQFAGSDGKFNMNDIGGMFGKKDGEQKPGTSGGLGDAMGGFFK